jgi:hypothetical protein
MSKARYINKLIEVAKAILADAMDPIVGCRELVFLSVRLDPDNDVFTEISGIEDQCEKFPRGGIRKLCSQEYLRRRDKEAEEFLKDMMPSIREACTEIINYFSRENDANEPSKTRH